MSTDLLTAFFERDLIPEEEERLGHMLADSAEAAERFAEMGATLYGTFGLPEPQWGGIRPGHTVSGGMGGAGMVGGGLVVGLLIGGTVAWFLSNRPVSIDMGRGNISGQSVQVPASPSNSGTIRRKVERPATINTTKPSSNGEDAEGEVRGDLLVLKIVLQEASLVEIRVLDADGLVVRRIASAEMPAGAYKFPWDGTDNRGDQLRPGRYMIQVKQGSETMEKWISIKPKDGNR